MIFIFGSYIYEFFSLYYFKKLNKKAAGYFYPAAFIL
jgi:hypothetical protein